MYSVLIGKINQWYGPNNLDVTVFPRKFESEMNAGFNEFPLTYEFQFHFQN